jgi:hypothetical protein
MCGNGSVPCIQQTFVRSTLQLAMPERTKIMLRASGWRRNPSCDGRKLLEHQYRGRGYTLKQRCTNGVVAIAQEHANGTQIAPF